MNKKLLITGIGIIAALGAVQFVPHYKPVSPSNDLSSILCNPDLWKHVYSGDPRRFKTPQDRLKVLSPCIIATGVLMSAKAEKDGDWHLQLDVEDKTLLNDKNRTAQKGYLVLEPICSNPISQKDTLAEHSCDNFSQHIFDKSMIGKRVQVVGVYVEDREHLWREVHPVSAISVIE